MIISIIVIGLCEMFDNNEYIIIGLCEVYDSSQYDYNWSL